MHSSYELLEVEQTPEIMRMTEKMVMLMAVDNLWKEHLYEMDDLREGIYLRSYAQLDPLVEYKQEAFSLFEDLLDRVYEQVAKQIFHRRAVLVGDLPDEAKKRLQKKEAEITKDREFFDGGKRKPVVKKTLEKVGRNDPCPCGSGKKYKKCCGANES
jgi:preprotein translocase subunit SecA